ncbi:phage tail protein [Gracilibacillus caseinilyticus]|uniref:Phage tail protein n=1 Tax=Gracilibacillus caseinilyticus TaxID=2932256 RepID=A0ABY4EUP4_9BACI|nr:phage tail spike protein [Gracilibacillus caseinilyticus]UOQ48126.1 phage tail protein [Gracilibacillus caseinilyticus]
MLTIYDKDLKATGIIENAYNISIEQRVNQLWTAEFSLPMDDPKRYLCSHMNYVEIRGEQTAADPDGRYYGLYRIMPTNTRKAIETNRVTYELEHVLATLLDDVINGLLPALINQTTSANLQRILNFQSTEHWQLGTVEFERYFQYSFENENGLLAPILSIPKAFDEDYEFTFDTSSYPWTLNLVKPSNEVTSEIRWGKDMISFEEVSDPTEIVNYIIPKGQGEGVNQLTIEDVNGGDDFLQDSASITEWGKRSYIWIDRRFKDADSLKESGQALLKQWKDPKISFSIDSVDLSILPEYAHERRLLNGRTQIVVIDSDFDRTYYGRIIEAKIPDLAKEFEVEYVISNRRDDAATIQADIERKQRINEAYSQGATNILASNYQDNCDSDNAATIPIYIDDDVRYVNTCELTYRTKPFRSYSQATEGGGATVKSTSSGGGTTKTTSSGGGTSKSTNSGGGTSTTSSSGGGGSTTSSQNSQYQTLSFDSGLDQDGDPAPAGRHFHRVNVPTSALNHTHTVNFPSHQHTISIPSHAHSFTVPEHQHSISLDPHSHSISLPDHVHDIKHGIYQLNSTPSRVLIRVDGNPASSTGNSGDRVDLLPYLDRDSDGKVTRGRHEITLVPNGLARIEADVIFRIFIQSDLGSKN